MYVANFEVKVSSHNGDIGNVLYAYCYGFTEVYLQIIIDSKQDCVKVIVPLVIERKEKQSKVNIESKMRASK
jgi:hypothetical protein